MNAAYPAFVALAPDDESRGALPAPTRGSSVFWYGKLRKGNFIGAQPPVDVTLSGGSSSEPNAGTLTSPAFTIPVSRSRATLRFLTWFEIEGVKPSLFDLMTVAIRDIGTGSVTSLGLLNPSSDPTTPSMRALLPFTSAGFNRAPAWRQVVLDVSAWRGQRVQLIFRFATQDVLYNGFRGWIIDHISGRLEDPATWSAAAVTRVIPLSRPRPGTTGSPGRRLQTP